MGNHQSLTGNIKLFPLLDYASKNPIIPSKEEGTFAPYTQLIANLSETLPSKAGWYLWGCFNSESIWETLYIGKAENLKTASLKARIVEELKDERMALWASVYGNTYARNESQRIYGMRYKNEQERALRKSKSTFIVWIRAEDVDSNIILQEEQRLITHYEPNANVQRNSLSLPTEFTNSLIALIDQEIAGLMIHKRT